jgi:hypothetical protein
MVNKYGTDFGHYLLDDTQSISEVEVTVKDNGIKKKVRKMTNDEIDNSKEQWYCDDASGTLYEESELDFNLQSHNAVIDEDTGESLYSYLRGVYGGGCEKFAHPAGKNFKHGVLSVFETIEHYLSSKATNHITDVSKKVSSMEELKEKLSTMLTWKSDLEIETVTKFILANFIPREEVEGLRLERHIEGKHDGHTNDDRVWCYVCNEVGEEEDFTQEWKYNQVVDDLNTKIDKLIGGTK